MVSASMLAEFDLVCATVLGDKVIEVVVDGLAGGEEFMAEQTAESGVFGRHGVV